MVNNNSFSFVYAEGPESLKEVWKRPSNFLWEAFGASRPPARCLGVAHKRRCFGKPLKGERPRNLWEGWKPPLGGPGRLLPATVPFFGCGEKFLSRCSTGPEENSSRYLASCRCYSTRGCGKAGERLGSTCATDVEGHKRRPPSKVGGLYPEFRV